MSTPGQLPGQEKIELEGTITAVKGTQIELFHGAVQFEGRGARIDAEDENFTNIADFKIGSPIEVEARVGADQTIRAVKIEVDDEKEPDSEISGVIGGVDETAKTFTIGPVAISWTGRTRFKSISSPAAGQLVEVAVEVSGSQLFAVKVEREEADD